MELGLSGQTAIVIGGASGIGWAIAEAFLQEHCQVGVVDLHVEGLARRAGLESVVGDIRSFQSMEETRDGLIKCFGRIDHVIVAAAKGSGRFGFPFWNLDPDDWREVLEVSLQGSVNVAHAYGPYLANQGAGTLLFLTSVAGQIGSQTDPPYSAAKAAVINFMQVAAKDLAPYQVRVNALSPGMVKTRLNRAVWEASQADLSESERQSYEDWAQAKIAHIAPLGEWQTPPEFGSLATYLASHHARNITGQTLNIDGGQVMHH